MSKKFEIPEEKTVPYLDQENSFLKTFKNGANSRKTSTIKYAFKRMRNYVCMILAYIAPSNVLRVKLNKWKGVNIGKNVYIGMFVLIDNAYPEYVFIEDNAAVNAGCMIITHFNLKKHFKPIVIARVAPILIQEGAMIAVRSIILPGVTIGAKAMVSAASVVNENVKSCTMVRGNPAVQIAKYKL